MKTVTASAPGKLMLFGEHAVVYGYPCIVTAVDLRTRVSIMITEADAVSIRTSSLSEPFVVTVAELLASTSYPKEVTFVAAAVKKFFNHISKTLGVAITTQSEFDQSYGLGSSSAVTVASMKALSVVANHVLSRDQIFKLSYNAVLEAQEGIGSGFDVAAATYGGTLCFAKGGEVLTPIAEGDLPIVVGYTGVKASTTEYVRKVAERRQQHPEVVNFVMENIGAIVREAKLVLEQRDYPRLGQLMNLNQGELHALGVSCYELDWLIYAARLNGAYGAKLSGAGGGDCMIALVSTDARLKVEDAIDHSDIPGAKVVRLGTGAEGVRIEN